MAKLTDFYTTRQPERQPVSQATSASNDTAPKPVAATGSATAVSWLGLLIAVILLRVLYEVAD